MVITYHSLEDRIVKNFLKSGNFEGKVEKDFYGHVKRNFELVNRKVIVPSEEEIERNPRARSAKLRIAERCDMKWFKKKKVKDFVSPSQEQKEVLAESMKEVLDGRLLADTVLRRNMGFILFLTLLGILYIANGYNTEKLYMKKVALEKELGDLRFESVTTASELMRISVPSEVERRVKEAGLELVQSKGTSGKDREMKRVYKVIKSIRFIKSKVMDILRTVFFGSYRAVKKCPVRNYLNV